jgi:hypothetical protein
MPAFAASTHLKHTHYQLPITQLQRLELLKRLLAVVAVVDGPA